ncbi:zinc finger BED domain-containing protein RICESLEEPER 2-like protein [Tanacetum coccineum]
MAAVACKYSCSSATETLEWINAIIHFIKPYSFFWDSHVVNFITHRLWENVDQDWIQCLRNEPVECLVQIPSGFLKIGRGREMEVGERDTFLYVPCPHTSEVLTNVLIEALMEWNVDTKLSTITLDNCSTNDKLIDMVKDKLQSCHLIKDGAHIHMRCCAHIVNLIVKVGLNVIEAPIENVRASISYWTTTPKRVEKFEETCMQLKITYSKTLGLDCQTRWNATYLMLKTALMYKDVFTRLKQRDSHYKTLPSPLEWENAAGLCSNVEVCDIRLKLNEWLVSPTQLVSNTTSKMIEKFNEYWGAIPELMAVAGVFDPRSKMEMIEEYEFGNNTGSSSANSMEVDENMLEWEKHIMCKSSVPQSCIVMEFDRYLEEGHEPRSPDFDILLWWKL